VEVAVFVAVGDGDGVMVGVLVLVEVGVAVGERNGTELQLRVMIKKAAIPRHMALNEMYCCFSILASYKNLILKSQRLAAHPPAQFITTQKTGGDCSGGQWGAWPLPICNQHFNRKSKSAIKRSLAEPWPSRLQPRFGRFYRYFRVFILLLNMKEMHGILFEAQIGFVDSLYQSFSDWYFCSSDNCAGYRKTEANMSFNIGDKVIHSTHGFAEIINVESKEVSGISSEYYVVQTRKLLIWIPLISQTKESLRLPTSKSNFNNLIDILRSHNLPFPDNRNERKIQIHNMLTNGATESVCSLIRDLSFCRKNNKLNETETSIYKGAIINLIDEWQYSMSISQAQAIGELNLLLDESYLLSSKMN
jgi:RNA polymerase-interacting CarD/CdnL/TRCF family regulator